MFEALITFCNGEVLKVCDEQLIVPLSKIDIDGDISVSQHPTYELWYHSSAGMIPSITELLVQHDFFHLLDDPNKIYKTSSVVTVENL